MRFGNLLKLVLRLEVCLLQAKGLCSGSDIIFPSTLLRLGLGNKYEACPSVSLFDTRHRGKAGACHQAHQPPGAVGAQGDDDQHHDCAPPQLLH